MRKKFKINTGKEVQKCVADEHNKALSVVVLSI